MYGSKNMVHQQGWTVMDGGTSVDGHLWMNIDGRNGLDGRNWIIKIRRANVGRRSNESRTGVKWMSNRCWRKIKQTTDESQTYGGQKSNKQRTKIKHMSDENQTDIEWNSDKYRLQRSTTITISDTSLWTWRYWSLESFATMAGDDAMLQITWELYNDLCWGIFCFFLAWRYTWPCSFRKSSKFPAPLLVHNKWWLTRRPIAHERGDERLAIGGRRTYQQNVITNCYNLNVASIETYMSLS